MHNDCIIYSQAIGQALRATPVKDFYSKHSKFFKRLQEIVLLGIVWNAFCEAFTKGLGLDVSHAIALLIMLPVLHIGSLATLFSFFKSKLLLNNTPGEVVAATFCSSHKTLAFGLPLIQTIFDGNPNLASYCAPIMLMHPLQLVIGSFIVPYFTKYTEADDKSE
jgi:solute carrier family 10 (sodium/bile acid cotransporter), member 7